MDVDSTLITQEVIELLAERAGTRERVAQITERAMRGEVDFAASLRDRVATLAGLPTGVLAEVRAELQLTPGAHELLDELSRRGWPVGLVSGGFIEVVGPLAADLGIRHVRANALEAVDGRLTGRVAGRVVDRAVKAAALGDFARAEAVPLACTVAIGDGANDLGMMARAGYSIAFRAKPAVRAAADAAVDDRLDDVLRLPPFVRDDQDARGGAGGA